MRHILFRMSGKFTTCWNYIYGAKREKESRYGKMAMDDGGANVTPNLHLKTNQAMLRVLPFHVVIIDIYMAKIIYRTIASNR
ncbi:hypothetical protein OUZ56_022110 [Daphnia magna]|uniref:Uncharacterized protein n=1 Tax=Daphnia magna TaxID=35525 RepID=A0ABR0AVJ2_9CRUS|nr:hypothetical protein OUZ56_022110 [Daphnia magna]